MENLTGRQFGPYQIIAPLGEGGMAAVYRAYQSGIERYVAVKVLPRQFAEDPQFAARFRQEAKLVAQLQHPHIVPVFDYGQTDEYSYIVMPFIQGGTLLDRLGGQPAQLAFIQQVMTEVGGALGYAHGRGMVHRDVKPRNILIDESGNCLLSDFGLARMMEASINLTTQGGIVGTPAYMSPEQGSGQKIDTRSDLYSLGVILYEMATGRVPFRAETPIAVVFKHIQDPLPPACDLNPNLPKAVERVIVKALAKTPDERYQSAAELIAAVQSAMREIEPAGVGLPNSPVAPQSRAVRGQVETPAPSPLSLAPPAASPRGFPLRRILWVLGLASLILAGIAVLGSPAFPAVWFATATSTATVVATPKPTDTLPPTVIPTATPTSYPTATTSPMPSNTPMPIPTIAPTLPPAVTVNVPCEEGLIKPMIWQGNLREACDAEIKKAGQVSLRLTADDFSDAEVYSALIPVQPNREYIVSYWVKTQLEVGTAQVVGRVIPAQYGSGAQEGDDVRVLRLDSGFNLGSNIGGATDWVYQSYSFATSLEAAFVRLRGMVGGFGTARGTVWFDQVALREK